jgi:hypothetical protein
VKTNWVYKLVKFLKKVYFRNDKRVAAYFICVAIAAGFWFLNALSKTYTVTLTAPVTYVNFPDNKTLASTPPDKFELKIKAHGFTILRHRLSFLFMPLEFNVNDMTSNRMKESRRNSYEFPSRQFLTDLSYLMANEMEILSMSPDTLYFKFDQMGQKKVKVKPLLQINLKKQYQISGDTKSVPDSVTVNGAQSVIDTIHFAFTEPIRINDADQTVQTQTRISQIKEVYFDPKVVEVNIPVEEYTESEQAVPVEMNDLPDDIIIKLFPQKVKISFQVGLSRFSEIKPEDFKLSVSYNDIREGRQRLKITAGSVPAYLYSIKISPEELEYLIEK